MIDLDFVVQGGGVYLNRRQSEAVKTLASSATGRLEVEQRPDRSLIVVVPGDGEFAVSPDGRVKRTRRPDA